MRTRWHVLLGGLLALLWGCGGDDSGSAPDAGPPAPERPTPDLRVAVLTDLKGYLEPCGCTSRQLGGIDRMAATLGQLRDEAPTLFLSAGPLLFSGSGAHGPAVHDASSPADETHGAEPDGETGGRPDGPEGEPQGASAHEDTSGLTGTAQQTRWQAETVAAILSDLSLAAAVPGPADFTAGTDVFAAISTESQLPWLAADLASSPTAGHATGQDEDDAGTKDERDPATPTGEVEANESEAAMLRPDSAFPSFERWTVREVGGVRIGLFGVTSLEGPDGALPDGIVRRQPSVEAAKEAIAALEGETDLIIGLVQGERRLAREVAMLPGLDFVVRAGLDLEDAIPPQRARHGWQLHGGRQGQGLLVLDLYRPKAAGALENVSWWNQLAEQEELAAQIAELEGRIAEWEAAGDVSKDDVDAQRARLTRMQQELASARTPTPLADEGRAFAARWLPLPSDAPRDPQVRERLTSLDQRINEHNREALADRVPIPVPAGEAGYVGSERCSGCHVQQYEWWRTTPHGHAYETLEERHKEFNLDCVGCHVTGYGRPGGATVTHNVNPSPQTIRREAPESVCIGCHNEEHSDLFDYRAYRNLLITPKHGGGGS